MQCNQGSVRLLLLIRTDRIQRAQLTFRPILENEFHLQTLTALYRRVIVELDSWSVHTFGSEIVPSHVRISERIDGWLT